MKKHLAKKGLAYMLMASMAISSMSVVAYAEDGSEQTAAVVSTGGEISTLGTEDSAEGQEDAKIAGVASVTVDGQETGYDTLANAVAAANRAEGEVEVVLDLL